MRFLYFLFSLTLFPLILCSATVHPLTPLSAAEITLTNSIIHSFKDCPKNIRFVTLSLLEPAKELVLKYDDSGVQPQRKAFAVLLDRDGNKTIEAVVNLNVVKVESWSIIAGVQPMVLYEEYDMVDDIVKRDSAWRSAMRLRGIKDTNEIVVDAWAAGAIRVAGNEGARLLRAVAYLRGAQSNFYGRPIEGITAIVNLNSRKVVQIIDNGSVTLAGPSMQLDEFSNKLRRPTLHPQSISQSARDFTVDSTNEVHWQNWRFRFMMHPREGLVLHQIQYSDRTDWRSVIYRIGLSEMVVPYGDTAANWTWRNAFDVGEYGIGNLTFPMDVRNDAPDNARFFDAVLADNEGQAVTRKNVIAVYERDGGLLWKHFDQYSESNQSRRGRELVVRSIATVGNYDYALNYIFKLDGSITVEAELTGIMLPKGVSDTTTPGHDQYGGHLVARRVLAPNHQHFFCFRIDTDVDGTANNISEIDAWSPPAGSKENPYGNAIVMDEQLLRHESEGRRMMDARRARVWRASSASKKNYLGESSSYLLVPGANAYTFLDSANFTRKRAGFLNYHLWSTRYKPHELYAAGDYPNQSTGGEGLVQFSADNEDLEKSDLVLWYVMGVSHLPRSEEYPVMNVHKASFQLVPAGFFDFNPAMDVRAK